MVGVVRAVTVPEEDGPEEGGTVGEACIHRF